VRVFSSIIILSVLFACEKSSNGDTTGCINLLENVNALDYPYDPYGINEIYYNNNRVHINVTYGGGCEEHDFLLIKEATINNNQSTTVSLNLSHDAHNDVCLALITEHLLCFDVSEAIENIPEEDLVLQLIHSDSVWTINEQ
tara:strand:- start:1092 stop:1517 length:426 start_codon:yes stop_codon:yes gene_type:complete